MSANKNPEEGQANLPSPEQVLSMIDQLHETITSLEGQLQAKSIKIRPPETFNGTQSKLQGFLTQLNLYMQVNREKLVHEADKVLFTTTYLTGPAFDWFEPTLHDYQKHTHQMQDNNTQAVFGSYQEFRKQLEDIFEDINFTQNTA